MEDEGSVDSVLETEMLEEDKHGFGDFTYGGGGGGMSVSTPHIETNSDMTHASVTSTQPTPYIYTYKPAGKTNDPGSEKSPQETKEQSKGGGRQGHQDCQKNQRAQGQEVDPLLNLPGGQ